MARDQGIGGSFGLSKAHLILLLFVVGGVATVAAVAIATGTPDRTTTFAALATVALIVTLIARLVPSRLHFTNHCLDDRIVDPGQD